MFYSLVLLQLRAFSTASDMHLCPIAPAYAKSRAYEFARLAKSQGLGVSESARAKLQTYMEVREVASLDELVADTAHRLRWRLGGDEPAEPRLLPVRWDDIRGAVRAAVYRASLQAPTEPMPSGSISTPSSTPSSAAGGSETARAAQETESPRRRRTRAPTLKGIKLVEKMREAVQHANPSVATSYDALRDSPGEEGERAALDGLVRRLCDSQQTAWRESGANQVHLTLHQAVCLHRCVNANVSPQAGCSRRVAARLRVALALGILGRRSHDANRRRLALAYDELGALLWNHRDVARGITVDALRRVGIVSRSLVLEAVQNKLTRAALDSVLRAASRRGPSNPMI